MMWILLALISFVQPDLIVESSLDRSEAYVGQRVIYTIRILYRIYPTSGKIELNEPNLSSIGLKSYAISEAPDVGYETLFGEEYRIESFRYILFPTYPGVIEIPPPRVKFEGVKILGNRVNLTVRPLPKGFHGAVGKWRIRARLSSSRIFIGTVIGYTVEITGEGDPDLVPEPEIDWPLGVKVERKDEDRSISRVIFRYLVLPQVSGEYVIPPARISVFDPDDNRTYIAQSKSLKLIAMEGPEHEFPKLKIPDHLKRETKPLYIRPWFIILQILPSLSILIALARRCSLFRSYLASKRALDEIAQTKADPEDIIRVIYGYIRTISGNPLTSRSDMIRALKDLKLSDEIIEEINDLLKGCERAKFSPEKRVEPGMKDRAVRIVREVASQKVPRWLRRFSPLALLIITSLAFCLGSDHTLFKEAVRLYESGDYTEALDRFLILAQEFHDGRLYYDIGLTYLRINDPARAIIWLERARRIMPYDRDLKWATMYAEALKMDRFEFADSLSVLIKGIRIGEILGFSFLLYWTTAVSFALYLWMGWERGKSLGYISGALLLISLSALVFRVIAERDEGVIVAHQAGVKTAPIESAPTLMDLHLGAKVRIESQRPGWFEVVTPTGERGWIRKGELILIQPRGCGYH